MRGGGGVGRRGEWWRRDGVCVDEVVVWVVIEGGEG
jgi:hypothetical protein